MDLKRYFKDVKEEVNTALERYLPGENAYPTEMYRAMRYSMFAGGKRVRPVLLVAAAEAVGGQRKDVMPYAMAIEMIHTYTLIHDDLPALDNDNLRRGSPTNHKVFGEANAILAGDALLTMAFQVMTDPDLIADLPPTSVCRVVYEIAKDVGASGTIGGQVVDLQSENTEIDISTLEYIHINKTGKMILTSIRAGAILGGGSNEEVEALSEYGEHLGLAFQIIDDVLDVEGDQEELGKDVGSDIDKHKATYPSLLGLEESKARAGSLIQEANDALAFLGKRGEILKNVADFIIKRKS